MNDSYLIESPLFWSDPTEDCFVELEISEVHCLSILELFSIQEVICLTGGLSQKINFLQKAQAVFCPHRL